MLFFFLPLLNTLDFEFDKGWISGHESMTTWVVDLIIPKSIAKESLTLLSWSVRYKRENQKFWCWKCISYSPPITKPDALDLVKKPQAPFRFPNQVLSRPQLGTTMCHVRLITKADSQLSKWLLSQNCKGDHDSQTLMLLIIPGGL